MDLPGVNAQEKTKTKLIESLKIGTQEMLDLEVPFEPEGFMTTINVPDPKWVNNTGTIKVFTALSMVHPVKSCEADPFIDFIGIENRYYFRQFEYKEIVHEDSPN